MLHKHGRSTDKYGLPKVFHINTEFDRLLGAFDRQEMQQLADQLIPQLTQEQKTVFDAITSSVIQKKGGIYMMNAPAGTGKTFRESTIAASLRARGTLVLCTASTGIAALILPGGLTAHSTFKRPSGPAAVSGSTCNIQAESQRADVLRHAGLLIWNECPMSSKYAPEALDLTLRDLMNNDLPFGGKTIVFSGDWRQCGPIVKFSTAADVVEQEFLPSHLWKHVQRFCLTKSMKVRGDIPYAQTVLAVGEGDISPITFSDGSTVIPLKHTTKNPDGSEHTCQIHGTNDFEDLIQAVYPDLLQHIDQINDFVLDMLPGETQHEKSLDRLVTDDTDNMPGVVPVEYLNTVTVPGTPPHDLQLKIGALVMFIGNINVDSGLVNGKKGFVRGLSATVVDVEVIAEGFPIDK
ncbi:unnamed protein product [Laminaria digitata]